MHSKARTVNGEESCEALYCVQFGCIAFLCGRSLASGQNRYSANNRRVYMSWMALRKKLPSKTEMQNPARATYTAWGVCIERLTCFPIFPPIIN